MKFREMIFCFGFEIVTRLLMEIQIWILTGNFEEAKIFYEKFSNVPNEYSKMKKIINENSINKKLLLFDNLELDENKMTIGIKEYPETHEGIIKSNVDR